MSKKLQKMNRNNFGCNAFRLYLQLYTDNNKSQWLNTKKGNKVMIETKKNEVSSKNLCVDIKGLQELLGVGIVTARKIGKESKAGFNVGKRKLYKVDKVNAYLETLIEK